MNIEEQILHWLRQHDAWEARAAAKMVERYGNVQCAYAEFTGDHIPLNDLLVALSDNLFVLAEKDERP